MRIQRIMISATLVALPLSTAAAQYYPQQWQPTAKRTTEQLNRDELAAFSRATGIPRIIGPRVPRQDGDGVIHGDLGGVILPAPRHFHCFRRLACRAPSSVPPR